MNTTEWVITSRRETKRGCYVALNVKSSGRIGAGVVTVKARNGIGAPYVCLSCITNHCPHIDYVRQHDTHEDTSVNVSLEPAA